VYNFFKIFKQTGVAVPIIEICAEETPVPGFALAADGAVPVPEAVDEAA
jgi:hypothetical protein